MPYLYAIQAVPGDTAIQMLVFFTVALLFLGAWVFTRQEYMDLS